jgi:AraC-like DNA-binding protein
MTADFFEQGDLSVAVGRLLQKNHPSLAAKRMAALLPLNIRDRLQHNTGACAVAAALLRHSTDTGRLEITVDELASIAGVVKRTVQRTFKALVGDNLLNIERRRAARKAGEPVHNLPSIYEIKGPLLAAKRGDTSVALRKDSSLNRFSYRQDSTANDFRVDLLDDTVSHVSDGASRAGAPPSALPAPPTGALPFGSAGPSLRDFDPAASVQLAETPGSANFPRQAIEELLATETTGEFHLLAERAAQLLAPDRPVGQSAWSALDDVRRANFDFDEAFWQVGVKTHQHRALLLIAFALLRDPSKFTKGREPYVAAILKTDRCRPEKSLIDLLDEIAPVAGAAPIDTTDLEAKWDAGDSPADWANLATRAVAALGRSAEGHNPWPILDELRREKLNLGDAYWQDRASVHGFRVLLAVAETLMRPVGFFTHSKKRYLEGILDQPAQKCAPERSIARLLAETEGNAKPAAAPELPLGPKLPKAVEVFQRPKDKLAARLLDLIGEDKFKSWFGKAAFVKRQNELIIQVDLGYSRDQILQRFYSDMRRAFGEQFERIRVEVAK